jgi:PAS domain S-box-containing protein
MSEGCRILIVDDDENARDALRRNLASMACRCATAGDGQEGLRELRGEEFDVVLIDLKMPRMGGLEMLTAMAQEGIEAVPVVLSGHGNVSRAVEATKLGAFDFLEKPASAETIRGTVERALKHRRLLRQARAMTCLARELETMIEASPDMIIVLDPQQRVLRANRTARERAGADREAIVGRTCHEAVCRGDHPVGKCPFHAEQGGGSGRSREFPQEAWGGWFEMTSVPLKGGAGHVWGSMHVIRDITDRKRAQEQLHEAHAQLQLLVASISSILICLDEDDRIIEWNAAAAATFERPAEKMVGRKLDESGLSWDSSTVRGGIARCRSAVGPVRLDDVRFRRADGKERFLAMTVNPMRLQQADRLGILILGRDITEQKLLEAQLAQAQKLEGIGQLAAGIAHEINTPMQYVGDNARFLEESFGELVSLLQRQHRLLVRAAGGQLAPELLAEMRAAAKEDDVAYLTEEVPKAIRQSLDGVTRVNRIVSAMREFSHPGTEEKAAIDLNKAVESTITISRNEWKYVAEMETDLDRDLPPVVCLPGELNQVFLNLIINAAHAIGEKVGDEPGGKGTIRITTRREGGWAEIRVSDTGCGIPDQIRSRVFDPFFTTKEVGRGTGQGLAIAHSVIVDKHGGAIGLESNPGEGTTFVVRIPIDAAARAEPCPAAGEERHAEQPSPAVR